VPFDKLPPAACWRHQGLRSGFEVAYFTTRSFRLHLEGTTTGLQDGDIWVVSYHIELDSFWNTRRARATGRTASRSFERLVESDGRGRWQVDGAHATYLDECFDVDLESSALTNALPAHRLGLSVGDGAAAPAAYIRFTGEVGRLDQFYARVDDQDGKPRYSYEAPVFNFTCHLVYDQAGLVLDYPGIATRAA
jgi:uncharacterized protein